MIRHSTLIISCLLIVLAIPTPARAQATHDLPDFSAHAAQAKLVLARMSLAEKIGQMTQADLSFLKSQDEITELFLGSVLSGGSSDPKSGNDLASWTKTVEDCQAAALATPLKIPLVYGIDAVHGHNNLLDAVIFPHNIGLGCTRNPDLVREVSRITALEVRASAINWTFAPCITVPRDIRWGRTYEGFSEDPELSGELGAAAVMGLQGHDLSDPTRVLACAKHFVADGGTKAEVRLANWEGFGDEKRLRLDQGDVQIDETTLRNIHLAPYLPSIAAGVGTIMPSYSSWNGVKCSASKELLTDILKDELGFAGFLISDYNAIDQITKDYKEAIKISTNAGMDMFMVPEKYREFIKLLTELVNAGEVSMDRIDDAVVRILQVKAALGLLDPGVKLTADKALQEKFGSPAHREVARQAVRESLVLLKNENKVLPISPQAKRIHVVGVAADDIGIQCGGWTVEWQGEAGPVTTGGTTLLTALREALGEKAEITFAAEGADAEGADVAIAVVGEMPYAEGTGDNEHLQLPKADQQTLANLKKSGVPTVVVLYSGRPLAIANVIEQSDAFIAAWLPGTEGAGLVDVLVGKHAPTGKLSFTWPRSAKQEPINIGDTNYDPLFPFAFGLTYEK
ncbi:MAG: glycoside hydrolase family 3 N-terminal domain-containing protein [Bythopirellula sp.]|nr:glycoside hydrolase family 3 N-terminal domain-containing protein [Bythopirellula sp.]